MGYNMRKCKFKLGRWECPLEALPGEEYCYWHLPVNGKKPTQKQLEQLKNTGIPGVYLKGANLRWISLENAHLWQANLQNAKLRGADLQGADLSHSNLKNADLSEANLQNADLSNADMQNTNLSFAKLQNADLSGADLQNAFLRWANLENTNILSANIQNAWLQNVNLHNANLLDANLQNTNLRTSDLSSTNLIVANLQKANLYNAMITPETLLQDSDLRWANLYRSYVDRTLTLRDAIIFDENCPKEINELVADLSKRRLVVDFEKLHEINGELSFEAFTSAGCYILKEKPDIPEEKLVIPFDPKKGFILLKDEEKNEKTSKIEEELKKLLREKGDEVLYLPSREELKYLYDASYEVYNKLYYFYIQAGKLEEALKMHYRRNEVRRKKRLLGGIGSKIRAVLYDWFLMKLLTGYGVKVERPLIASFITIGIFALLFKLTNGIVKVVNGKPIEPDWFDYLYHSVITFTSLGYSNIQPNLNGHLPQLLVSVESFLGVLLTSLLIYTVTFRISR